MNRRIGRVTLADFYQALRSLGYYGVKVQERRSEWRRGAFHLYTYPRAKSGLKLALHKDVWKTGPPVFSHEAKSEGEEIEQELDTIKKRYREIRRKPK